MKGFVSACLASMAVSALAAPRDVQSRQTTTPTVDLGYEVHSGSINSTGDYYLFSNIPYAEQPVGDLRFQKVSLPTGSNSTVNDGGSVEIECMQAYPEWIVALEAAAYGLDVATMAAVLDTAAGQTESCLYLDVYVPVDIFEAGATAEAPVAVWIHGGGFSYGSKSSSGEIAGLLNQAGNDVIIVAINYRLGLFGWIAGDDSVTPNLGLFDQLVAFEWVAEYISLFGGSADKITAIGESAGAASILHHITGYGGAQSAPFAQAIIMSPAFQFNVNTTLGYQLALSEASSVSDTNVASVAELSALTSAELQSINQAAVYTANTGDFVYGPTPDGDYVPTYPQVLLLEGKFDADVKVLITHTSNESVPFTDTTVATASELEAYVELNFPEASADTISYMLDTVWPDVLDGTYPWETEFARAVKIGTEAFFACSTRFLAVALGNNTYNGIFAYPPGYHAQDLAYFFFNGDTTTTDDGLPVEPTIAYAMQDYYMTFVKTADPNYSGSSAEWPVYGADANVLEFTYYGVVAGTDDMDNSRCTWIQQAMSEGLLGAWDVTTSTSTTSTSSSTSATSTSTSKSTSVSTSKSTSTSTSHSSTKTTSTSTTKTTAKSTSNPAWPTSIAPGPLPPRPVVPGPATTKAVLPHLVPSRAKPSTLVLPSPIKSNNLLPTPVLPNYRVY
ncbi:Alpha/Beta hydrolase protein [Xylariales sp. PMI_506]|nr:Alpha/Beta hydrolase protein [Xylariales sp. PMI_506]